MGLAIQVENVSNHELTLLWTITIIHLDLVSRDVIIVNKYL